MFIEIWMIGQTTVNLKMATLIMKEGHSIFSGLKNAIWEGGRQKATFYIIQLHRVHLTVADQNKMNFEAKSFLGAFRAI